MKKLTKILSLLLAVALVCTGLILAVSANNGEGETASYVANGETVTGTLAEALAAADENTTVTLMGDCTLEETFTVTKSLTVDLNGNKLVAKTDAFVIGANDITFTITGTGSMNLAGKLASAAADFSGFTVEVIGTKMTDGIDITHTNSNIVSTYNGNWYFTNLDIVSTSNLAKGDAYFFNVRDPEVAANWNFELVSFDSTAVEYKNSCGNFIVTIAGGTNLNIYSSAFRTQNSGINAGHALNGGPVGGDINIFDSLISCVSHSVFKKNHRNYVLLGNDYNFTSGIDARQDGFNGVMNIENSTVECNSRLFCCGTVDAPTINMYKSTMRLVGIYGEDTAYSIARGEVTLNLEDSAYIGVAKSSSLNNPPVGTRSNLPKYLANLPSGTVVAYDPYGNVEAPYVVVNAGENISPDYYMDYGFDTYDFTKNYSSSTHTGNRDIRVNNTSPSTFNVGDPYWPTDSTKGMQWDNKLGTITHVLSEESSYVKYWIPADPNNPTATTRKLVSDDKTDTYFVMGLGSNGHSVHNGTHLTAMSGENRKAVVVAEFEFATEADGVGYPYFAVVPQVRTNTDGGAVRSKAFAVTNAGNIVDSANLKDAPEVLPTLNAKGEWNRMSMVCYSDPANSKYLVYIYLNGEYMGWVPLVEDTKTADYFYFQGIRISFANNSQKVNSNLLIDNVSLRAYTDYQFEGEMDSTFNADTGAYNNDGVYFPEKYIIATPTHKALAPTITVGGVSFADVNEALAYATYIGAVVDINANTTLNVTENGVINTNGYDVKFTGDSYGYVADGNFYTFSDKYQYTAYFYTGDLEKLNNGTYTEEDFEKVLVKVGDYLNKGIVYTGDAIKNFTDMTISGSQSGWVIDPNTTASVLPKYVTVEDLALADENNSIYYFPSFASVSMTYYVTDAEGTVYAGDVSNEQAMIDFQALKNGDTFVLLGNVNLSKANAYFTNTTDTTEQVINIDLNGNTLSLSETGALVKVGSYTTLNVYSSKPGAMVNCVTYTGGKLYGNYAFVIDDPAVTEMSALELADNVKSAKINVGTIEALGTDGANMVIVAETALQGKIGDDDCRIVCDGVDIYAPSDMHANTAVIDARLFNGEVYVKNALIVSFIKANVFNLTGFYEGNKPAKDAEGNEIELSNRQAGFENGIVTSYMEVENCIVVNKVSGMGDNTNDNIVGNNGDGTNARKNLKLKNVVTAGRLNPSNANRTMVEGLVVAEKYDLSSSNNPYGENTVLIGKYNAPMTFDALDLGVETVDGVLTVAISYYDAAEDRMVNYIEYKLSNNGVAATGSNAYMLPVLTKGTSYESELVTVTWTDLKGEVLATDTLIKGGKFNAKTGLTVENVEGTVMSLAWDGTFTTAPAYVTESITLTPGYTVKTNVSGIKANLSLYTDFDVNLYIPAEYMDYITVDGYTLTDATLGEANFKKITVTQACNETTDAFVVTLKIAETVNGVEYTDTKVITYSVAAYAETVLNSQTLTDSDKVLAYYMVAYANAATAYVDGAADETLTAMLETYAKFGELYTVESEYANAIAETNLSAVFSEATVTLDPKPAFVLTVKDGFVGTVVVKYADGSNERLYTVGENTKREIVIEGMKLYNFSQILEITAEGTIGEEMVEIKGAYSLDTFAKYHSDNAETNETSAACLPLINALRAYAEVAYIYKTVAPLK